MIMNYYYFFQQENTINVINQIKNNYYIKEKQFAI